VGGVGGDRQGAWGALGGGGRGARVLGDRDARESSRGEEGQMHVGLSFSDVVGKEIVTVVVEKNDRFRERRNERWGDQREREHDFFSESGYGKTVDVTKRWWGQTVMRC
jgi:hypothetical protein